MNDFLEIEKETFEKIYVDINYAIDNIKDFVPKDTLCTRKYTNKIYILKEYLNIISKAINNTGKKSFFNFLSNENKNIDSVKLYKSQNEDDINQLQNCFKCACLNCIKECKFDSCLGCKSSSYIKNCDHFNINLTKCSDFKLNLVNNNTNIEECYDVLGTIQDISSNLRYIFIKNIKDKNDKYILRYYPVLNADEFGEITDANELDTISSIFQQNNID